MQWQKQRKWYKKQNKKLTMSKREIKLKPLSYDDLAIIHEAKNNEELVANLSTGFRYSSEPSSMDWLHEVIKDKSIEIAGIWYKERANQKLEMTGIISFSKIDTLHRTAELHVQLFANYGVGLGSQVLPMWLEHGFDDLNLNRIYLHVQTANDRAVSLYNTAGFQHEGLLRQSVFKKGEYRDRYIMSILRSEYLERKTT